MKRAAVVLLVVACGHPGRHDAPVARATDDAGTQGPVYDPADPSTWSADDYQRAAVKLDTITCPAGTRQEGEAPPAGDYAYCVLPSGERHGPWMTWPSRGNQRKLAINDHDMTVAWTAWHSSNDALEIVMELRADKAHGRTLRWHDNGQLAFDCRYVDDHPEGWCRAWDRDGTLLFDEDLDARGGTLITWDGDHRREETWRDGQLHGKTTQWYPDGKVESITGYVAGEARDLDEWHRNGVKAKEWRRRHGGADDVHKEWDETGRELPRMCAHGPCDAPPYRKYVVP